MRAHFWTSGASRGALINDARDNTRELPSDTDLTAAVLLIALGQCTDMDVLKQDWPVLAESLGLVANGEVTKLGRRVSINC